MRRQEGYITHVAAAVLTPYTRVKLGATGVEVSGAADLDIGVTRDPAHAIGDSVAIAPFNATGTIVCTAAVTITKGAAVYGAANGQVNVTPSTNGIGIAQHAAAAGDQVEVMVRAGLPAT